MENSKEASLSHATPDDTTSERGHGSTRGILIVSLSRKVLHVNARALELERRINPMAPNPQRQVLLNPVIANLYQGVKETLASRTAGAKAGPCEIRSAPSTGANASVILQGFGLPGAANRHRSRVVIVMWEEKQAHSGTGQDRPKPGVTNADYLKDMRRNEYHG